MGTHEINAHKNFVVLNVQMCTTIDYVQKIKDRGNPAKCTLCDGAHSANFKGCHRYLDIVSKRYPSRNGTVIRHQKPLTQHVRPEHTVNILQVLNLMRGQLETWTYAQVVSQQMLHRNNNTFFK